MRIDGRNMVKDKIQFLQMQTLDLPELAQLLESQLSQIPNRNEPHRLLFGRGGGFPDLSGINIDRFPPLTLVTLYEPYCNEEVLILAKALETVFSGSPLMIQDRSVRPATLRMERGEIPREFTITETGLNFLVHPDRGQNPGFFPDMRIGRKLIRKIVAQKCSEKENIKVLNLFAYTCSLSVAAVASGASKVVNIDMNRRSLDIGKRNHRLNHENIPGGYQTQAIFLAHDIYKSFGKLKKEGPYDLIIADPPPNQKGSFLLVKDYPRLIKRLPDMLLPEGHILLANNLPGWTWEEFETMVKENLPLISSMEKIEPPDDYAPKVSGRGLKVLNLTIDNHLIT